MAKNVELMGAVFPDCPAVMLPTHEGPLARFTDVSDSQAVAADVAQGKQFYLADGTKTTGTNQGGGGGGGGGGTIKPNARLVLIDYDGSIVDSYTQSEINALSALPANPDHSGDEIPLTSQGWNWTLAEIREQLAAMPEQAVYVGQMYVPTDGKTHLLIYIDPETPSARRNMTIYIAVSRAGGATIDWGDGTTEETTGTGKTEYKHTYNSTGEFDIKLTATNATITLGGSNSSTVSTTTYSIYGVRAATASTHITHLRNRIRKVHIGANIQNSMTGAFGYCHNLEAVTVPRETQITGNYIFFACYKLKCMTISAGTTSIGTGPFQNCYGLGHVSIPIGITSVSSVMFSQCFNLRAPAITARMTSIGDTSFNQCIGLTSITIPEGVTSITATAFNGDYSIREYHLKPATPPTLSGSLKALASDCVIYVPYSADHSILAAYQAATNWSTYASQMVEEAE